MGRLLEDIIAKHEDEDRLNRLASALFPAAFGADDDGGDDDGTDDTDDDDDDDDGDDDGAAGSSQSKEDPKDLRIRELSQEAKNRRIANRELKKQMADIQAKLKQFEDKDKSDSERYGSENAELKTQLEKATATMQKQAVRLAFYDSGMAGKFKNPATALKLLDLDDVEVDDGEVDASVIKEKAEALLKAEPYLAASGSDDTDNEDDGKPPDTSVGSGKNGKRKKPSDAQALAARFPALQGRVRS